MFKIHIDTLIGIVGDTLSYATKRLEEKGISSASLDAEILLAYSMNTTRQTLLSLQPKTIIPLDQFKRYIMLIDRRCKNEPVAYLTQEKEFMGLEFHVTPDVLIPRPETELLVEEVISRARELRNPIDMLDIGTGSGCIAVSCAKLIENVRMVATDKSKKALMIAKQNAKSNEVTNKIKFYQGDLFRALPKTMNKKQFDFVISNPPYIASKVFPKIQKDVRKYEPKIALVSGKDGLTVIKKIISQAPGFLKPNGYLIMEIGYDQGDAIKKLLKKDTRYSPESIIIKKDYANLDRIAIAQSSLSF